jgi:hypothetical protein
VTLAILSLAEGNVALFANQLSSADVGFADARQRFERFGANPDDLLTYTIEQQATVAQLRGEFASTLAYIQEANAAAKRFGERGTSLALQRLQTEGYLLLDLADPSKAVEVLQRGYDGSVKRYVENHANRLVASVSLAVALSEFGDGEAAARTYDGIREQIKNAPFDIRRNALLLESALPGFGERGQGVQTLQSMLAWTDTNGNSRVLDPAARTTVLRRLGELLIAERQPRDALIQLQQAEASERSQNTKITLALAQIWVTQAIAHLQLREHSLARAKLTAARPIFADVLGANNPRALSIDVYTALANVTAPAFAAEQSTMSSKLAFATARSAFSRLQSTYSGPKRLERLSAWFASARNESDWKLLPAFIP